ncbi:helix-turn-helix domain-containing protein [Bacillus subtilis]
MTLRTRLFLKTGDGADMFSFFNIGKPRTNFGKWIDREGITQIEIEEKAKLSRGTVSKLCNDKDYVPKHSTWSKIERALKSMGYEVDREDYFSS